MESIEITQSNNETGEFTFRKLVPVETTDTLENLEALKTNLLNEKARQIANIDAEIAEVQEKIDAINNLPLKPVE